MLRLMIKHVDIKSHDIKILLDISVRSFRSTQANDIEQRVSPQRLPNQQIRLNMHCLLR